MASRQYIGARYVPILMGEWDKTLSYEALNIVTYKGNSFTSKKPVPQGTEIDNTEYWINTGNYNAQVNEFINKVNSLTTEVNGLTTEVNEINQSLSNINSNLGNISELPYPTDPVVNNVKQIHLDLQSTKEELNNTNNALAGVKNLHFRYSRNISMEGNGNWNVNAFEGFKDIQQNKIAYVGISISAYSGTRPDVLWHTYGNSNEILIQNNNGYVHWNMLVIYTN